MHVKICEELIKANNLNFHPLPTRIKKKMPVLHFYPPLKFTYDL